MASRKRMWFTRLADFPVNWACYDRDTRGYTTRGKPWARLLRLTTITEDGRELETILTPNEARTLARRLNQQADAIDRMNREHSNGWAAGTEQS